MKKSIYEKKIVHIVVVALIGLIAYSNTFHVPFQFDDESVIVKNPIIKDLGNFIQPDNVEELKGYFEYAAFKRRYIGMLAFALNYSFSGLDVTGYHVVNIAIHIINALLVYALVILTFKTPFLEKSPWGKYSYVLALFTALLFVSHPVQTQAVTYIVQRMTSLATLFYLAAIVSYISARLLRSETGAELTKKGQRFSLLLYVIALCSACLGMNTKEIVFTLPVTIFLYEIMFLKGKLVKRAIFLIPIMLTMLIIPLSMIDLDNPIGKSLNDFGGELRLQTEMSRADYLFTQFRVLTTYVRLLFLPVNQNIDYDYPVYQSFFNAAVFPSFIFLVSIVGAGVYLLLRYRNEHPHARLISFGIFWFFITISLESSVIPITDVIFEHRLYLPSIGFFIVISWVMVSFFAGREKYKLLMCCVFGLIVVSLMATTYARNMVWKDHFSLWQDVVKKSPKNARAFMNLGLAFTDEKKDHKQALAHFNRAVELDPEYDMVYFNRGNLYAKLRSYNRAIEDYTRAISLDPDGDHLYHNRGGVYVKTGQFGKAIDDFSREIEINERSTIGYADRGYAYLMQDNNKMAVIDLTKAISMNGGNAGWFMRRGFAYADMGDTARAASDLKKACAMGNRMSCGALRSNTKR